MREKKASRFVIVTKQQTIGPNPFLTQPSGVIRFLSTKEATERNKLAKRTILEIPS